jgi:hypothetical protein
MDNLGLFLIVEIMNQDLSLNYHNMLVVRMVPSRMDIGIEKEQDWTVMLRGSFEALFEKTTGCWIFNDEAEISLLVNYDKWSILIGTNVDIMVTGEKKLRSIFKLKSGGILRINVVI